MKKWYVLVVISFLFTACASNEQEVVSVYPNGNPMKINEFVWKGNTKVVVKQIRYTMAGEKEAEENMSDGKKDGLCTYWYPSGEVWIKENYKEDLKHGEFVNYYMSGEKNFSGEYSNGLAHGEWIFWNDSGDKYKKMTYENGVLVEETDLN